MMSRGNQHDFALGNKVNKVKILCH